MYFVGEFALLLMGRLKWPWSKRSSFGTRLLMNFLTDLARHILELASSEKHGKRQIWVVGRSGCRLSILSKKGGMEGTPSKFLAISQHAVRS